MYKIINLEYCINLKMPGHEVHNFLLPHLDYLYLDIKHRNEMTEKCNRNLPGKDTIRSKHPSESGL